MLFLFFLIVFKAINDGDRCPLFHLFQFSPLSKLCCSSLFMNIFIAIRNGDWCPLFHLFQLNLSFELYYYWQWWSAPPFSSFTLFELWAFTIDGDGDWHPSLLFKLYLTIVVVGDGDWPPLCPLFGFWSLLLLVFHACACPFSFLNSLWGLNFITTLFSFVVASPLT